MNSLLQVIWQPVDLGNPNNQFFGHSELGREGVYIVADSYEVIRVGKDTCAPSRILDHIRNPFNVAMSKPPFRAWFAPIRQEKTRQGVERYLGVRLQPRFAERFPDVAPIACGLPPDVPTKPTLADLLRASNPLFGDSNSQNALFRKP